MIDNKEFEEENFKNSKDEAEKLLNDKKKAKKKLEDAFEKANKNKGKLEEVWNYLQLFFSISKDYLNGSYKEIPKGSIIAIMGSLVYFLSPIDLIPDFIPVVGFLDDIAVLGLVFKQVKSDLDDYEEWKNNQ
ncbi:YkvA family protein [Flavobacterium sp. KB82]|uniref:DUF1232 domain-containing protein n=1 Tax=Flavobacterium hungaricum TaxID=2082725 RepID=A0ABR9THD7_9FLAO|nr:DUF1232 domain-containing protein [Flavobacterium hungaricum]